MQRWLMSCGVWKRVSSLLNLMQFGVQFHGLLGVNCSLEGTLVLRILRFLPLISQWRLLLEDLAILKHKYPHFLNFLISLIFIRKFITFRIVNRCLILLYSFSLLDFFYRSDIHFLCIFNIWSHFVSPRAPEAIQIILFLITGTIGALILR